MSSHLRHHVILTSINQPWLNYFFREADENSGNSKRVITFEPTTKEENGFAEGKELRGRREEELRFLISFELKEKKKSQSGL